MWFFLNTKVFKILRKEQYKIDLPPSQPMWPSLLSNIFKKKQFEDTIEVIRSRKLKKDRQHNDQKKGQTKIYKTLHRKLKIEQHDSHTKNQGS